MFDGENIFTSSQLLMLTQGSAPPEKHKTVLSRLVKSANTSLLFHTTSVYSRSSPSFSRGTIILPPFTSQAFIHALQALNVDTHYVTSEADGVCVSLAAEKEAYILGLDSDFLILVSTPGASRVKGYCPLDMMMWIEGASQGENAMSGGTNQSGSPSENDGWNVARPKAPRPTRQSAFLPPSHLAAPTLVLTSISPDALRHRLRLPASVIPLLASFIGNDYTPISYPDVFFEPGLSVVQKVEKVSRVLRETVFAPSNSASKTANAGDQAVSLVKKVITKLAYRPFVNETMVDEMVDTIIEASFQYILPDVPTRSPTYPFNLPHQFEEDSDNEQLARERYSALQKRGMEGTISDVFLWPGRSYVFAILEMPSGPSLRSSESLREVRRQAWGILEEGCGGLCWPEPTEEELRALQEDKALQALLGVEVDRAEEEDEASDEDEDNDDTLIDEEESVKEDVSVARPRPRVVVEYVRQGSSQKVAAVEVALPPLSTSSTPACLAPIQDRLKQYLSLLSSDTPLISSLPPTLHPLLAVTRLSILEAASRATPTRNEPKWKKNEVAAVLKMGLGMYAAWEKEGKVWRAKKDNDEGAWPMLANRPVGIMAQFGAVMKEALLLAQALLILPEEHPDAGDNASKTTQQITAPPQLTHLTPFMFVSGITLHTLLANEAPPPSTGWRWTSEDEGLLEKCMQAVVEGIEGEVVGWHATPTKRDTRASPSESTRVAQKGKSGKKNAVPATSGRGGRYGLLEDLTI